MIAAPASGQGKTAITAALLRLLRQRGVEVAAAKVGPDYIDPAFHAAASGRAAINLDPWAMSRAELARRLHALGRDAEIVIIEAVMGLFDGSVRKPAGNDASPLHGIGSSADLAAMFGIPVLLVVDAAHSGQSAAAVVHGFASLRPDVRIAGIILNRLGSPRHAQMLSTVIEEVSGLPVVGRFHRDERLQLPERHLGLVPASEHPDLQRWLDAAAEAAAEAVSLCRLANLAAPLPATPADDDEPAASGSQPAGLPPLGQRIALARDEAFCFAYPHLLQDWHARGAEIHLFSPLADEAPPDACDAIFLPGGYPELHAGRLAAATRFRNGMRRAAERGALIYGECGGFMVLGRGLVDNDGTAHAMCDLLPVTTSFADRHLHLGYRQLRHDSPLPFAANLRGHEFHYASTVWQDANAPALFEAQDAGGTPLPPMGLCIGRVMGSFAHVISAAPDADMPGSATATEPQP